MSDVTRILSQIDAGDAQAAERLLPLVYDALRELAAARMAREKPGQTLTATALVHEAYVRLVAEPGASRQASGAGPQEVGPTQAQGLEPHIKAFNSRGHFFAAAAEAMRRILIESARRKRRIRHGGQLKRVDLDSQLLATGKATDDLLALDEAMQRLALEEPEAAAVVKLRYFAGLTIAEAAAAANISVRTANRHWAYAKAWLYQQLS